ncbi:hypothetical protein AS156_29340 [Bradyrhizobium macuxiense]|uniref:Uncharacterized protein n=1 Tax=Bradyrhizobium macuxiense TaxID=1755647 RepID=A0A120FRP6_9BRAD|nr:hypothetical protein AS156_29340 [Bradyrhizobium macuxiense]
MRLNFATHPKTTPSQEAAYENEQLSSISLNGEGGKRALPDIGGHEGGNPKALLPIMAVVLAAFLVIGLAIPVLPLHVHQDLGLSAFVVGLVTGSQFAAVETDPSPYDTRANLIVRAGRKT